MRARSIRSLRLRLAPSARKASLLLRVQSGWFGASARSGGTGAARSLSFHLAMCAALIFVCSAAPFGGSARAAPAPNARTTIERSALPFPAFVAEASQRFGIPAHWIRAVMRIESGGDPRAVSPVGAMGLMQIMPKTYAELRARHQLGPDPYDPRDNILAGAAYLREMLDRYGSPGFLAAYNAGPLRYDAALGDRPTAAGGDTNLCRDALADDRRPTARKPRRRLFRCCRLGSRGAVRHAFSAVDRTPNCRAPECGPVHSSGVRRIVDLTALSPHSEGLFVRLASREREQ